MTPNQNAPIRIDLNQFKLHLTLPAAGALSLHFDTPSRRFYLSVITLVIEEMKNRPGNTAVLLEPHAETLALLNETVGGGKGSSKKKRLLGRIYKKWKSALPDLEKALLFKVMGRKKGYEDETGPVYRFDDKAKDLWANLFEYAGSREKIKLRFAVERLGVDLRAVEVFYAGETEGAWERFLASLIPDVQGEASGNVRPEIPPLKPPSLPQGSDSGVGETLKTWLNQQGGIEKIPLKTRLELIAWLAGGGDSFESPAKTASEPFEPGRTGEPSSVKEHRISGMLIESISARGSTPLYTAPEVREGQAPSPRSEVYALGVLMYQLVVGDLSRPLDENWQQSVPDEVLRQDIAACVETLPEKRLGSPLELTQRLQDLDARRKLALAQSSLRLQNARPHNRRKRRWIAWGVSMALILALLALPAWYYQKVSRLEAAKKKAYETNLPRIRELLKAEKYVKAYALAQETEKIIPKDPTLLQYIKDATDTFDIESMPAGARVFYKTYEDAEGPWVDLGKTPIKRARIPAGMMRFRIQKAGYGAREVVQPVVPRNSLSDELRKLRSASNTLQFQVLEEGRIPEGMVVVDGGRFFVPVKGVPGSQAIVNGPFFIDRLETTNREYKEFVDLGGYGDPRYWKEEFKKDGETIPWEVAVKSFVDRTGRLGPGTWKKGTYPEGQGDFPVSGISWYEAAAYARFRGKSLPTLYHWARAAFTRNDFVTPLAPSLIVQSNIEKAAVAPVGSYSGIASCGAKDMAGNVREWCWNAAGDDTRYCLGGSWRDPAYTVNDSSTPSAWDRSETNGVRCVYYPANAPPSEAHLKPADLRFYDPYTIPPRSRESLETLKKMVVYKDRPLDAVVESRKPGGKGWLREKVTLDAGYDDERLIVYLDLPTHCKPPFKAVSIFPA